ncbi:MAG: PQQ-dependent sugar dehydrogenase [Tabrizicola sp.]|nr:PQQ-dependent sugar dehydrogenase [Tabrizicola sp.]
MCPVAVGNHRAQPFRSGQDRDAPAFLVKGIKRVRRRLAFQQLRRVDLDEQGRVVGEDIMLTDLNQRIRDVRSAPDGYLYVTTDYPASGATTGRVLRLMPAVADR